MMMVERAGDYLNLFTIEAKMQGAIVARQAVGYAVAALFGLLAVVFLGIAIIVTCWETDYRILAAWLVFAGLVAGAGVGIFIARKHASASAAFAHVREEFKRDVDLIKESL